MKNFNNAESPDESVTTNTLPVTGFLRLPQIIGNPKTKPPTPPLIPVCKSSWWDGVKNGIYPQPVKIGPRTTAWKVEDICELIDKLSDNKVA